MAWKRLLCCVMICMLLVGCGQETRSAQKALDLRTSFLDAGGCQFTAVIGADYGERMYSFSVSCLYRTDGSAQISVLQPEEIAGITAVISDHGAVVEFEDLELDFGKMADGNVSPMECSYLLAACWEEAYIASSGKDGDLERVTYLDGFEDEELTVDTWIDHNGCPVYGEVAYGGSRCLTVTISDFQWLSNRDTN